MKPKLEACALNLAHHVGAQVEELVKTKLEKPKTLRQLAARHWAEIERGTLLFDRQQREAAALRGLTKRDVASFFKVLHGSMHVQGSRSRSLIAAFGLC